MTSVCLLRPSCIRCAEATDECGTCVRCEQLRGAMIPDAWAVHVATMELVAAEVAVAAVMNIGRVE